MDLPCDPSTAFLGIYPKDIKTYFYTETHTLMCRAVLFTVTPNWKLSKYLSLAELLDKLMYTCTMEYLTATKKRTIDTHNT
jgi:hypothetical protein